MLNEQRNSRRYRYVGSAKRGQLRLGDRDIDVELLDESATGFAVLLDDAPPCAVGDTLLLQLDSTASEVRVANIHMPDPLLMQTRIGLTRLDDLPDWDRLAPPSFWAETKDWFFRERVKIGLRSGIGALLFFSILPVILLALAHDYAPEWSRKPVLHVDHLDNTPPFQEVKEARIQVVKKPRRDERIRPLNPKRIIATRSLQPDIPKLPVKMLRATGASIPDMLLHPRVSKLLGLTDSQLDELSEITKELKELAWKKESLTASDAQEQVRAVEKRMLDVLSEAQRTSFMHLMATESPGSKSGE